jgi:hypothetical protein
MRKTARPVVWEGAGAQSPASDPIFACGFAALGSPKFLQVYHLDLEDYWCENHLAAADVDRDGWNDVVLMVTGLLTTNGPPWHYKCRAILLHNEGDGTFTDSILAGYSDLIAGEEKGIQLDA